MIKNQNKININTEFIDDGYNDEDDENNNNDDDDDEYIKNLKKNFNLGDNLSNCSDNLSDNDLNNYKLNNELVALANEVSKTFNITSSTTNTNNISNKNNNEINKLNNKDELIDLTSSTPISKNLNYDDEDDECLLPEFDWANLEAKLKEESIQREYLQQKSDRDEIRRKLATDTDSDDYIPDYLKKGISSKSHLGQNLQICFMNESISDCENSNDSDKEQQITTSTSSLSNASNDNRLNKQVDNSNNTLLKRFINNSTSSYNLTNKTENIFTKQLKLQQETKQALEIAQHEAKVKIELEQQAKKPSPLADIVGLPSYGIKRLDKRTLNHMNIGKLQLIENDLRNQIEKTNEDLKLLLIERDEFYMQQDSILVDIEDLTKRLQEYAQRLNLLHNKQLNENQMKSSKSTNEILTINSTNTNSSNVSNNLSNNINNRLNKIFPINSFTNKLYRFTKKS